MQEARREVHPDTVPIQQAVHRAERAVTAADIPIRDGTVVRRDAEVREMRL